MITNNYFSDDPDLQIFFEKLVDWEAVVPACEGESYIDHKLYQKDQDDRYALAPSNIQEALDLYRSTLEALGDFCGNEIAPRSATLDKAGLKIEDGRVIFHPEAVTMYEKLKETGLLAYAMPRSAGGLGLPATMAAFYSLLLARADVSFTMTINLLNLAQIVSRYGTDEQNDAYAAQAAAGEAMFAMSLTEPDYGSDLSNVRTTAVKQPDGSYRLNGTKRFISQGCGLGDYPAILLTLARTGKPGSGARGLSVFLVKSSDVTIAGLEHKMGIHASPTCEVVYEDTPGELVGKEGQGLTRCTLGMTNFMRLCSAAGGAGGSAACFNESLKYAQEREQFGKPIHDIVPVKVMLEKQRRLTNAMRLLSLETAFIVDMYQHEQIRMEKSGMADREIRRVESNRRWHALASLFTPMAKYYCSEEGFTSASLAIQIHGGAGYTEEYDVARIFRDSRINTIYEGTSQIQVGMAVGGINAGMAGDGYLRHYLETKLAEIDEPSAALKELGADFETAVEYYKDTEDRSLRERMAEDVVRLGIHYLVSILYEIATGKIDGEAKERWQVDKEAFLLDSLSDAKARLYRLRANQVPALV